MGFKYGFTDCYLTIATEGGNTIGCCAQGTHVSVHYDVVHCGGVFDTNDDGTPRETGWAQIEDLIRERRHSVFAGHFHRYQKYERNNQDKVCW